jgi:hypothetical protein
MMVPSRYGFARILNCTDGANHHTTCYPCSEQNGFAAMLDATGNLLMIGTLSDENRAQ